MLIRKQDYPERSDLVICTVTKIQFNSIFVKLDEYKTKQGIIHISEISPGRIRNIRDYVKEGKVIVCLVLRVNRDRDLIELSLRRVTDGQRRNKINEMKQEQKAEKIIEFVAKSHGEDKDKLFSQVIRAITPEYDSIHTYFENVVTGSSSLKELGLEKKILDLLDETIKQRIKLPEVFIKARFKLHSFERDAMETIKSALKKAKDIGKDDLSIVYQGAGKYDLSLRSEDYKTAERILEEIRDAVSEHMKKNKGFCEFERTDK